MDLVTLGTILKNRIKECGYTQEDFAEKAGIGMSTLRKQINGTVAYRCDDLIMYAELLNCSYDYLLGYSKSVNRESANIVDKTGLSDEAVLKLIDFKKEIEIKVLYDDSMRLLNTIICDEEFLTDLLMYLGCSKPLRDVTQNLMSVVTMNQKGDYVDFLMDNSDKLWLIPFSQDLERIKLKMRPDLIDEMREDIERVKKNIEAIRTQAVVKADE